MRISASAWKSGLGQAPKTDLTDFNLGFSSPPPPPINSSGYHLTNLASNNLVQFGQQQINFKYSLEWSFMCADIYAFKKNIHETVIMTDCKNCGQHSGQNMKKSVFGQVQTTHVRMNSGDRPNILRASWVNSKICTRAYL